MSKIRINDLARELEVKSKAILDVLVEVGVTEKKTHSSSVEEHEAEKVRAHFRAAADAQSAPSRSARSGRDADEIKTKIDLSHISKPGDVLKQIARQQHTAAAPAAPPARPAPPVATKPAAASPPAARPAPPAPKSAAPPTPPAPACGSSACRTARPTGDSSRSAYGEAECSNDGACGPFRRRAATSCCAPSSSAQRADRIDCASCRAAGRAGCTRFNSSVKARTSNHTAAADDCSANWTASCLQSAATQAGTTRPADCLASRAGAPHTGPADFPTSTPASAGGPASATAAGRASTDASDPAVADRCASTGRWPRRAVSSSGTNAPGKPPRWPIAPARTTLCSARCEGRPDEGLCSTSAVVALQ